MEEQLINITNNLRTKSRKMSLLILLLVSNPKPVQINLNPEKLTNATVKKAIEALQTGNKPAWFALFSYKTELLDDGNKMNFRSFFEKALGHERFISIDKVENNGLDIYGRFHSEQWGDFKTYFKFHIGVGGIIDKLEIGQAD